MLFVQEDGSDSLLYPVSSSKGSASAATESGIVERSFQASSDAYDDVDVFVSDDDDDLEGQQGVPLDEEKEDLLT